MYSSVIILLCLFLFHASMADSTMDLLKLSARDQVLVLNSQIKDLKVLFEHQHAKFSELTALVNIKISKLESKIEKVTHSEVATTTATPSMSTSTTTPTKTATTMGPLSVNIKDQALLLHIKDQDLKIKDQDIKIAKLEVLVEHQNTKFSEENAKFSEENAKFLAENAKFAKVETKIYKLETEMKKLTNFQAATTSSPSTTTSSTQTTNSSTIDTSSGVVFTRWGRRDCPAGISTPVYNGTVGGSYYDHTGAAVNHLCMPHDPTWDVNKWYKPSSSGYVYSGLYSDLPDSSLSEQVASCAVCRAASFSTKVMIPGRDTCYPGWTKAYNGELVSGNHGNPAATEYACLDKQPQKGVSGGSIGLHFFPVLAKCGLPYHDGALLTCVICLK